MQSRERAKRCHLPIIPITTKKGGTPIFRTHGLVSIGTHGNGASLQIQIQIPGDEWRTARLSHGNTGGLTIFYVDRQNHNPVFRFKPYVHGGYDIFRNGEANVWVHLSRNASHVIAEIIKECREKTSRGQKA